MEKSEDFKGKKITVMGLGLNGGGLACVRFLAEQGALVTATDLRNKKVLQPSLEKLTDLNVRFVLGEHRMEDFRHADFVIKNPAVSPSSPFLAAAPRVETDLSLFLSLCKNPILAVTGSKGKSSVVSALHHIMKGPFPRCRLGGNITRSPLTFLDELNPEDPVILELSSWQLHDLKGRNLLHPEIAVLTNLMNDHQNSYASFADYADDKMEIFRGQKKNQTTLVPLNEWGLKAGEICPGNCLFFEPPGPGMALQEKDHREKALWMEGKRGLFRLKNEEEELLPEELAVPGSFFRFNCLLAGGIARLYGLSAAMIRKRLASFPGIPHRMELTASCAGVDYYNDTTATIPEAMAAGVNSFQRPVHLICGGNDKELNYDAFTTVFQKPRKIYLLAGSASEKMIRVMKKAGVSWEGPFTSMEKAINAAHRSARAGEVVLMSPGATSFGLFINEFHRGDLFRSLSREYRKTERDKS